MNGATHQENALLLSVIVPVYNMAGRLGACIDSLLAQELPDFELILVDDGSTDASPEICRKYREEHPERITFLTGPNGGVSVARNRGLDVARGEWVAFCDSDDRVQPALYRYLHDRAVATGSALSCCALRRISPAEERIITNLPCSGEEVIGSKEEIFRRLFVPLLWSRPECNGYLLGCLFRRDLVEAGKIRFVEGVSMEEDELFLLQYLLRIERMAVSDRPLYDYMHEGNSLCSVFYFRRSELFREQNWYLRSKRQREIFQASGLETSHPEWRAEFWLREYYHEVQMVCCDGSLLGGARRKRLTEIAARAWKDCPARPESRAGRIFCFLLFRCRGLMSLFCRFKRKKDEFERKYSPGSQGRLNAANES